MIWFISQPREEPDGRVAVDLFEGIDEDDYYDAVMRLRVDPSTFSHSIHDEILLAIDERISARNVP